MRSSKPLHLADLDPQRVADELTQEVYARANRDLVRLGLSLTVPIPLPQPPARSHLPGDPYGDGGAPAAKPKPPSIGTVLRQSKIHQLVRACVEWAKVGKGKPEEMAAALRELRSDLDGVEPGVVSGRALDPATDAGVPAVAAGGRARGGRGPGGGALGGARLARARGAPCRATVTGGTVSAGGPGRPMRFAADVVREYLYARGVPGFAASEPTKIP